MHNVSIQSDERLGRNRFDAPDQGLAIGCALGGPVIQRVRAQDLAEE